MIRAARPVPVVSEKLEHQIEQLHRYSDIRFRHWSDRSRPWVTCKAYNRSRRPAPVAHCSRIGSIRLGSLFLTLPTRVLTGQQIISSEGYGASAAFKSRTVAGCSPSQAGHESGFSTTGMRLWSSAHNSFGCVVMIAKERTHSPAGECQFSISLRVP